MHSLLFALFSMLSGEDEGIYTQNNSRRVISRNAHINLEVLPCKSTLALEIWELYGSLTCHISCNFSAAVLNFICIV